METVQARPSHLFGHQGIPVGKDMITVDSMTVPPDERLNFWRRNTCDVDGIDLICNTRNYVARTRRKALGQCTLIELSTQTPHRVVRSSTRDGWGFANIQLNSHGILFRGRREYRLGPGNLAVYSASSEYELDVKDESSSLVIAFPLEILGAAIANLDRHLEGGLEYDARLVAILVGLCKPILAQDHAFSQAIHDDLAAGVMSALAAAVRSAESSKSMPTWGQSAIQQRVKAHINANIQDPDLSPAGIAEEMGITVGYLHKVFRSENNSVMRYILNERLERCRIELARSESLENVSQIAFRWGFSDASHFARSFRNKFGVSPRDYRRTVLEQRANRDRVAAA